MRRRLTKSHRSLALRLGLTLIAATLLVALSASLTSRSSAQEEERTGAEKPSGVTLASGIFTSPSGDATALAQSLVGAGEPITVSNATLSAGTEAAGFFTADPGVVGFDDGIILSSGRIGDVAGPNDITNTSFNNGAGGDGDLSALSGFTTFNATVLEFDFDVNFGQTVTFNYVFASEEYHEFVNTQFNDVFAFFVNGVNCATVDGDPVSVNTINDGNHGSENGGNPTATNPGLFRGNRAPNNQNIDTEMDGLTVVLACDAAIADGTNHMKLAIADASDQILDANVFLEAGSLQVNSPPTAVDDSGTTPKNVAVVIDLLGNDNDPDGDPLSIANLSDPANGSVVDNGDGTVTYTPDAGFVGADTFTYQADDGLELSNTATVTVDVFNQPPDAVDDFAQTTKHTSIVIAVLANDSDPDGDPLSISAFDAASALGGTVVDNGDGTLTYTSPNQSGFDTFTYTISDNDPIDPLTDTATVTIEIINQPPDCSLAAPSISTIWPPNHQFVAVDVVGITDPDGDPLTITVVSIFQDEPTDTIGDGSFVPDGQGIGTTTAEVRAERSGSKQVPGNGRVYHITFLADDGDTNGTCQATVTVGVPHDQGQQSVPVDDGALFDSTV